MIFVVLIKGTKVLAHQTLQRLEAEFDQMNLEREEDVLRIYDIMNIPELTPYVLAKKLILVVKKQTKNLDRLSKFFEKYTSTANKKILIIDDGDRFIAILTEHYPTWLEARAELNELPQQLKDENGFNVDPKTFPSTDAVICDSQR